MYKDYLKKFHETHETAYYIIARALFKPRDEAEASLKRLVARTWKPERRPLYQEALNELVKGEL